MVGEMPRRFLEAFRRFLLTQLQYQECASEEGVFAAAAKVQVQPTRSSARKRLDPTDDFYGLRFR